MTDGRGLVCGDECLLLPVLSGLEGDGTAGRALDAARAPGTADRQRAFQRLAPRAAADVALTAVQAAEATGAGRDRRQARRRRRGPVPADVGRTGATSDHRG